MCSFSGRLRGCVLAHDTHGNHLSAERKTVANIPLAKKNMEAAADMLKGFWQKDTYASQTVHVLPFLHHFSFQPLKSEAGLSFFLS